MAFKSSQQTSTNLFDEEPAVSDEGVVENAEHQERLPTQVVDSVRRGLAEYEIEQPLRRRASCDTNLADTVWENLGHVKPGHRPEAHIVSTRLEEDHRN